MGGGGGGVEIRSDPPSWKAYDVSVTKMDCQYNDDAFIHLYIWIGLCVCVCVCVCERERERESACVCARACVGVSRKEAGSGE